MANAHTPINALDIIPDENTHEAGRISIKAYLFILLQLGIVAILLRQYQIENAAFLQLALLAFCGFAVHALLPLRYRLSFFLLLSLTGIMVTLDPVSGLTVIAIGLMLAGICHLPVSIRSRSLLLLAAGSTLIALRAKWIDNPVPDAVWPILGSMFMFRLIIYFYELRHDTKSAVSPTQTLSYFFMLPNACFPLFPVIDYKTFKRNYYDDDAFRIYQHGIDWIVRGIIHLILYRYIYYHLTLAPEEVSDPEHLSQYLVANFLLYLRISGLFHLIVGMLHLFGFRLPETHNRYLLAYSFTDFWRRINIYWKEFMQKIFYYPTVFYLRKLGTTKAMVLATLYVFLLTWFLHAYQWFWLRGTLLLVLQDVLFWAILGVLVVLNALYEIRYGRSRKLGQGKTRTLQNLGIMTLKSYITFWCICILWSFWTAESLTTWFSLWSALGGTITAGTLILPGIVLAVILLGNIERNTIRNVRSSDNTGQSQTKRQFVTLFLMLFLVGIGVESIHTRLNAETATLIHSLRSARLSRLDTASLERGYYENLLSVDRFNSQLWEVYTKKPAHWLGGGAGLKRFTGDFNQYEMTPSVVLDTNYGPSSINRWGMRDKDYQRSPPLGITRMVMLGASTVMGWGVADGETFESLIENRLNQESSTEHKYEILNFGVQGYQPLQQLITADKALEFKPDALVYIATGREISRATWYLVEVIQKEIDIPFAPLREIAAKAGITKDMDETTALKHIKPFGNEILAWTYRHIAERASASGAVPVLVFLPQVREGVWQEETPDILRIAEEAGFTLINLADVYKSSDIASVRLAEWDDHPNKHGHELIASRLYDELTAKHKLIFKNAATPDK